MKKAFAGVLIAQVLSFFGLGAAALEIQNFKSGLVCPDPVKGIGSGWICFQAEEIPITGQGKCTYDGKENPCTWYGFEFDYRDAGKSERISCVTTSSRPIHYGDPDSANENGLTTLEWTFDLKPGSGRYYNPQYSVFSPQEEETTVSDETVCSASGAVIFRQTFRATYPKAD